MIRNNAPLKRGFIRLSGHYAALKNRGLMNWRIRGFVCDVTNRLKGINEPPFPKLE